ncbi:hypothetical protein GE061_006809, partial [Apolygus lucorum]
KDAGVGQGSSMVLPVIYSMPDSLNNNTSLSAVKSALSFLSGCAHEKRDLFRVYPLPELFFNLWKKYREGETATVAILDNEIEKDVFSFAADLGCEMHEKRDLGLHCSLSIVKRWVFTICDNINKRTGIPVIPGRHAPLNADVEWSRVESSKRMNPAATAGYIDPSPQKSPPQFVDLTKMQEIRYLFPVQSQLCTEERRFHLNSTTQIFLQLAEWEAVEERFSGRQVGPFLAVGGVSEEHFKVFLRPFGN